MTSINEAPRVVRFTWDALAHDTVLVADLDCRVSREPAVPPTGPPTDPSNYPIIEVGLQAASPVGTINAKRVHQNTMVRVSIWVTVEAGQGWDLLDTVTDRVDSVLQGLGGTIGGVNVIKLRLVSTIDTTDEYNRNYYPHRVLLYYTEASVA